MSKPDYKTAHAIVDTLAAKQTPGPNVENETAWRKAVRNGIRAEHFQMILAELETGASPEAIIATISRTASPPAAPVAPQPPTFTASEREDATPFDRARARARIAQIRETLGVTR